MAASSRLLLLVLVLSLLGWGSAVLASESAHLTRYLVIQDHGQLKSLEQFASEVLFLVTGSRETDEAESVNVVLSIMAEPARWKKESLIWIPSKPLREMLGLAPDATHASFDQLIIRPKLIRMLPNVAAKQERNETLTELEREEVDAYERAVALKRLFDQKLRLVPPPTNGAREWLPVLNPEGYPWEQQVAIKRAWASFLSALCNGEPWQAPAATRRLITMLHRLNPSAYPTHLRVTASLSEGFVPSKKWDQFSPPVSMWQP